MKNRVTAFESSRLEVDAWQWTLLCRPSCLYLVTDQELEDLRCALCHGHVPLDFEAKLCRLARGSVSDRQIEQGCRLFIALVMAAYEGSFRQASAEDCERILTLLAYVRKDDDAIPDYAPTGFTDDQQEMQAGKVELEPLLRKFKAWRLQHQVPAMWAASV